MGTPNRNRTAHTGHGPLPYIDDRAVKRVKDAIPTPTVCNICEGSKVELVCNDEIYGGRQFGKWPYAYLCRDCGSYVGVHNHTDIPLGTLADAPLREARKYYKQFFINLCKSRKATTSDMYRWLASKMEIAPQECHWGMFDIERCRLAGQICMEEGMRG